MRSLIKHPEPEVLAKNKPVWTENYLKAVAANTKPQSYWGHEEIRRALRAETDDRCAYCDSHVAHVAQVHIEHYRPRSKFPHLVVQWDNLTVACPRCNSQKSDTFDDDLPFIYPFCDEPSDHFVFYGELILAPNSERGEFTIQVLGLNSDDLVSARRRCLVDMTTLVRSWYKAHSLLKDGILSEIHRQFEAGEFKASVEMLLRALRVPLPGE